MLPSIDLLQMVYCLNAADKQNGKQPEITDQLGISETKILSYPRYIYLSK